MFDPEKLKVGDVFYSVKERNQSFARKKIYQEIDEYRWFRYDRPLRTYEIVTHKVLGILRKQLEGQWRHDPDGVDMATEYHVRYQDETHAGNHTMDFYDDKKYFVDINEAIVYKETMELTAKELDKT
jgi:predicted DNA-binding ArsR family transcriptional regulator